LSGIRTHDPTLDSAAAVIVMLFPLVIKISLLTTFKDTDVLAAAEILSQHQ
jgi:hypothetical protein